MKLSSKHIAICGMFSALIVVGAFIKVDIPLPLYTMHFTLQWFFVMMAAMLLGARLGSLSVLVYLCIGLMGVPVFAAGGGIGYVFRPGFGFLLGFAASAFVMGLICEKINKNRYELWIGTSSVGLLIYYTIGAIYFYLIKNIYVGESVAFQKIVVEYCLITVIPDFILCILASVLCKKIKPQIDRIYKNY